MRPQSWQQMWGSSLVGSSSFFNSDDSSLPAATMASAPFLTGTAFLRIAATCQQEKENTLLYH